MATLNQQEDQNGDLQKKSFSLFTLQSWGEEKSWILCRIIKVKGTGLRSKALLFVPWVAGLPQATQRADNATEQLEHFWDADKSLFGQVFSFVLMSKETESRFEGPLKCHLCHLYM